MARRHDFWAEYRFTIEFNLNWPLSKNFGKVLHDLYYYSKSLTRIEGHGTMIVCNFSRQQLTLKHVKYLALWLENNNVHLHSLDLSTNDIESDSFEQLLSVVQQLQARVTWLAMGGNQLPKYDEPSGTSSDALDKLRASGHVSLALLSDSPKGDHAEAWKNIAKEYEFHTYDSPRCASAALFAGLLLLGRGPRQLCLYSHFKILLSLHVLAESCVQDNSSRSCRSCRRNIQRYHWKSVQVPHQNIGSCQQQCSISHR